jgi:hypothetical protein
MQAGELRAFDLRMKRWTQRVEVGKNTGGRAGCIRQGSRGKFMVI